MQSLFSTVAILALYLATFGEPKVPPSKSEEVPEIYLADVPTVGTPSSCPASICPCSAGSDEPCNCLLKADPVACTGVLTVTQDMLQGKLEVVGGEVGNYKADVSPTEITSLSTTLYFAPKGASSCVDAFGGNPLTNGWHISVYLEQAVPPSVATCAPTMSPFRTPSIISSPTPVSTSSSDEEEGNFVSYVCSDGDTPYLDPTPGATASPSGTVTAPSINTSLPLPVATPKPLAVATPKLF